MFLLTILRSKIDHTNYENVPVNMCTIDWGVLMTFKDLY